MKYARQILFILAAVMLYLSIAGQLKPENGYAARVVLVAIINGLLTPEALWAYLMIAAGLISAWRNRNRTPHK